MTIADRVHVEAVETLSNDWYVLKKTTFRFLRSDGTWQTQSRETYDRGNGATILLYDPERRTVVLTRQFRYPAFVNGHDDLLIEAPAGLLDDATPEERIKSEVEEETGYRVTNVRQVFDAFMSPGSVTERLHFFVAVYSATDKVSEGGGNADEGEDIERLEPTIEEALEMIRDGRIRDGKTIMLLQYAALNLFRLQTPEVVVRKYREEDLDHVIEVFERAVREVASNDYTPAQIDAWAQVDRRSWSQRRLSQPTWVAKIEGKIAGFADLQPDGHIDMMFVHPSFGRLGVASRLLRHVEEQARSLGICQLSANVSITARRFFERHFFEVLASERAHRNGEYLDRVKMEKRLFHTAQPA